jgi:hypothetical protein
MRSEQETTDVVRAWLEDGVTALPDRVIDRVLHDVPSTRQRRAQHALVGPARVLVAAAVLVAMVVGGVSVGQRIGDAIRPTSSPAARSLVPVPPGPLESGQYVIDTGFPVRISFDVPEGWSKVSQGPDYAVLTSHPDGAPERPPSGVTLGFYTVANLMADPCDREGRLVDPPVGPTVEDLVAAFKATPAYTSEGPRHPTDEAPALRATPTSIDGHPGQRIDLNLQLYMCPYGQAKQWQTPSGSIRAAAGDWELSTLWIVDVGGERLVVDATSYPLSADERVDELRTIVDSIQLQPADDAR